MPVRCTLSVLFFVLSWLFTGVASAVTAPGSEIINKAQLTYIDTFSGEPVQVDSNTSRITVAELRQFTLTANQDINAEPGEALVFVHTLSNTGNVDDEYSLSVLNSITDQNDLDNLQLSIDVNANGQLDADEPLITGPVTVAVNETLDVLVTGRMPLLINPGDLVELILRAESSDTTLDALTNTDIVTVKDPARLELALLNTPECAVTLSAGDEVGYKLDITNRSDTLPAEQQVLIDGAMNSGVLVNIAIPAGMVPVLDEEFDANGYQATAIVQQVTDLEGSWISRDRWTEQVSATVSPQRISKLAVLMPQTHFVNGETITLRFTFAIDSDTSSLAGIERFDVEAGIDSNADRQLDSRSNTVCNQLLELAAAQPALLRFVEPVDSIRAAGEVPDGANDEHFQDTEFYRINTEKLSAGEQSGQPAGVLSDDPSRAGIGYALIRDGVYIELTAAVSADLVSRGVDGADYINVDLSSNLTGDTLVVLLRETLAGSDRYRSVAPVMLSSSLSGEGRWCPEAASSAQTGLLELMGAEQSCVLHTEVDDTLSVSFDDPFSDVAIDDKASVDPSSRVFDSNTLEAIAGATVTLYSGGEVATSLYSNQPLVFQTDSLGRYFLPQLPRGSDYSIGVDPPDGYVFPSRVAPERFGTLTLTAASYGEAGYNSAGQGRFAVSEESELLVIDIPVDPANQDSLLQVEKAALSEIVDVGDAVGFQVVLTNSGSGELSTVTVLDTPAYGFRLVRGSVSVDGVRHPDPDYLRLGSEASGLAAGADASIVAQSYLFDIGTLQPGQRSVLTYHLQATAAALNGDGVNTAIASASTISGVDVVSQTATAGVRVARSGVLSEQAMIFGKVYVDSSCDGIQNKAEWPVGGVKLYLQDGSFVVTDEDGQYSLYGLRPGLHVIKVDPLTLPLGLDLKPVDNRNAADAQSRFVDLSDGDFHRADFAAHCPQFDVEGVYKRLEARNRNLRGSWLLDEASRFNPDGKPRLLSDRQRAMADGDLSSGLLDGPRVASTPGVTSKERAVGTDSISTAGASGNALNLSGRGGLTEQFELEADVLPSRSTPARDSSAINESTLRDTTAADGRPVMGDPKQLVVGITADQANSGTWLWPETQYSTDGRFMAVVRAGTAPQLFVNGDAVSDSQIGERIVNRRERAELVAWYGVSLKPGINTVEVKGRDSFGNERILASGQFKRPAAGVSMSLRTRQDTLPADGGRTLLPVDVVINDANGYPANGVYFVTLETTAGDFLEQDLQSSEPGVQVRIENGRGKIHVRSSELSGRMQVKARSGSMQATLNLVQVAAARPLVGAGLLELGGRWSTLSGDDDRLLLDEGFEAQTRAALFLKGRVRNDMKLTLSYDSDKNRDTDLLRDVNPNDHYPTLGDASVKGFEAQSRSKLYAKLERDRHSVMWGDYLTDNRPESDSLARVQRTLTGFNALYNTDSQFVQLFMARQSDVRASEEIRGNGTAMLFRLQGAPLVANSEVIERIVRDQNNPGLVISVERLRRFIDYQLDSTNGLLSFSDVVPTVDDELNPVFIRASYDRTSNLDEYTVAGLRWQYNLADRASAGVSLTDDQNPLSGYTIAGVHASVLASLHTSIEASAATMSHRDGTADGTAQRVSIEHLWNGNREHRTLMSWSQADTGFTNADAGISAGREEWKFEHYQPLSSTLTASAKVNLSQSTVDATRYGSAGLHVLKKFDDWSVNAGTRRVWSSDGVRSLSFNTILAGAERRLHLPGARALTIGFDAERDISDASRFRYGVDSRLQLFQHVSVYARYEREQRLSQQSLTGTQDGTRQWLLGIESDVLPSTQLYSEYRMRGSYTGRNMETASGVRGRYELSPGLNISPALEVIDVIRGNDAEDSVAVSLGISDSRNPNRKLNGQAELRESAGNRYYGFRATLAQRLNLDWTALVREEFTRQKPSQGQISSRHQLTLGLARRPKLDNRHHAVFLANWKQEYGPEEGQDKRTYLLSSHHNRQFNDDFTVSGRLGMKWQSAQFDIGNVNTRASLMDIRGTYDLTRRWELDVRGGWLGVDGGGGHQYSLGAGVSWIVDRNVRLGLAYNVVGFNEADLDAQGFNRQGVHLGLQFKFDEEWFQWLSD